MSRADRVAVMSPQTRLARARHRGRLDQGVLRLNAGEAERARALYRAQRRPALVTLALLVLLLAGLPLVFAAWPALDAVRIARIPLSWLMLGVLPFPAMAALAFRHLRHAESIEDGR